MPLRQTIGISIALLMASSAAIAQTPEKGGVYQPGPLPNGEPGKSCDRSSKSRIANKWGTFRWPSRLAFHRSGQTDYGQTASGTTGSSASPTDPSWGPMHTTGYEEIGQASWYDLVGGRTSSGERLDTENLTAAHRSLPLGSCAKVTSLDTGRSVIVKINDRGPFRRHFIIDLSPRAATELGMVHTGVAAVAVEPVADGPAPADANPTVIVWLEQAARK
jgi:rare lipoprotein A